jgi:hypothetical protein
VLEQPYAAAKRAESEAMRDDTQTPVLSLRLLEEIGDVSDDDAFGEGFRSAELQSRSMQKAAQEEKEVDRLEEEPSYSEDVAEEHAVASQTAADFQSIVENLVRDSGGSVRTVDYGERYEIPKSMVVKIPLETLENFIRDLRQYAEIDLSGELILSEELAGTGVSVGAGEQVQTVMIGILFQ